MEKSGIPPALTEVGLGVERLRIAEKSHNIDNLGSSWTGFLDSEGCDVWFGENARSRNCSAGDQ